MSSATHGFWSGRQGLGHHFWLYFVLPIAELTGTADSLHLLGSRVSPSPALHAALFATAALVAIVTAVPLFKSIVRSNKGLVWKILVAVVSLLAISTVIRLAYDTISQL